MKTRASYNEDSVMRALDAHEKADVLRFIKKDYDGRGRRVYRVFVTHANEYYDLTLGELLALVVGMQSAKKTYERPLDVIQEILDGTEWDSDTTDSIAYEVRRTGRVIGDVREESEDDGALRARESYKGA